MHGFDTLDWVVIGGYFLILAGLGVAAVRLILELNRGSLDPSGLLHTFATMNFLSFAAWFFLFSVTVCVVVSLATAAPAAA